MRQATKQAGRHKNATVLAAAVAGLRETMRELGHRPARKGQETLGQSGDHVTVVCEACAVALSAFVDYDAERVELTGTALGLRCSEVRP